MSDVQDPPLRYLCPEADLRDARSNPVVRAWRRFWLCRKWDGEWPGFYNLCLRRRWHRGVCEGFAAPPLAPYLLPPTNGSYSYWNAETEEWTPDEVTNRLDGNDSIMRRVALLPPPRRRASFWIWRYRK